ncbi:AAA family ATPase [Kribbella sp. CA-294648]|uniref:ATP-binding protein n=1 Tax=Kribbella sp. CA-294648 TaxID=3239948 RepID=UPI003D908277
MLGSPFTPRPGDPPAAPSGRVVEFDLMRGFGSRMAAAQVQLSNGLLIAGSKAIGKTAVARAAAGVLGGQSLRVAVVEWDDRQKAGAVLRRAMDDQSMRSFGAVARTQLGRLRSVLKGPSVSVGLKGPSVSSGLGLPRAPEAEIARNLVQAGEQARRTARPAVIVIDDLQKWSPREMRELCQGLADCARADHPIGVVAFASPAGEERLARADEHGMFSSHRLGPLTPRQSAHVLEQTAAQRGVQFDPAALEGLVKFSQGHPRRLQLAAHEAWEAAPAGDRIDAAAADHGIAAATAQLDRGEHTRTWRQLTAPEQALTQTLAARGGSEPRSLLSLQQHVPRPHREQLEQAVAGLVRKDVIQELPGGRIAFNDPGTEGWVLRNRPPAGTAGHMLESGPTRQIGSPATAATARIEPQPSSNNNRSHPAIER